LTCLGDVDCGGITIGREDRHCLASTVGIPACFVVSLKRSTDRRPRIECELFVDDVTVVARERHE
jgi:hypothetical protein